MYYTSTSVSLQVLTCKLKSYLSIIDFASINSSNHILRKVLVDCFNFENNSSSNLIYEKI